MTTLVTLIVFSFRKNLGRLATRFLNKRTMIKYIKTGEKLYYANTYDVFLDSKKIGFLYRDYYPAIGLGPKYVGYAPGSYEWKFDVEEWAYESGLFRGGMYIFNTKKEMKAFLEGDRSKWKWCQ